MNTASSTVHTESPQYERISWFEDKHKDHERKGTLTGISYFLVSDTHISQYPERLTTVALYCSGPVDEHSSTHENSCRKNVTFACCKTSLYSCPQVA